MGGDGEDGTDRLEVIYVRMLRCYNCVLSLLQSRNRSASTTELTTAQR